MDFKDTLALLVEAMTAKISEVYHLDSEAALHSLQRSAFMHLLEDETNGFWMDDAEMNFRRYQNEIEYGAWNKNECGGIVQ